MFEVIRLWHTQNDIFVIDFDKAGGITAAMRVVTA
jgi:L-alanine-DL-glutamate epimerase-like enolase superfamily enzyme